MGKAQKVASYDKKTGKELREFHCIMAASMYTKVPEYIISGAIRGVVETSGNVGWRAKEKIHMPFTTTAETTKEVLKINAATGKIVEEFESICQASQMTGILYHKLLKQLKADKINGFVHGRFILKFKFPDKKTGTERLS